MDSNVAVKALADGVWLVELIGEHDLATTPALVDALAGIQQAGANVVLDLTRTSFIDSSIVGVIARQATKQGERVVLVAARDSAARKVLNLVQLGSVLRIVETREEAVECLRR